LSPTNNHPALKIAPAIPRPPPFTDNAGKPRLKNLAAAPTTAQKNCAKNGGKRELFCCENPAILPVKRIFFLFQAIYGLY
jgi:hypothetical protein